ncbi:hypothetical protein WA171_003785 [Blastocystis sp. BT1]
MDSDGLKSIPLGQLMEMRKNGQELRGVKLESHNEKTKKPKRANKNAPQELSSKQRPKNKRHTVEKREVRDPRFDGLSGKFNYDLYRKSYRFIEEKQEEEIKELKQSMFNETNDSKKKRIQAEMTRVMQQKVTRDRNDRRVERKREFMKQEREAVSKGKKPFFLKKRELREAELKDRFEALNKRGKLNKYMEKKRRRNAKRDEANMPVFRERE